MSMIDAFGEIRRAARFPGDPTPVDAAMATANADG
jgi:hypothetical protein